VLRDLGADLRFELRGLRRRPGFAALVVLSLALGIGAKAAIFSVLHALLLRPLPVREPERLAYFSDGLGSGRATRMTVRAGRLRASVAPGQYFTWQAHSPPPRKRPETSWWSS
jgi:hypothetical protein